MIDAHNARCNMLLEISADSGNSSLSNGELARLVQMEVAGPQLAIIQSRRKALNALCNFPLWKGYDSDRLIRPREISIPNAYGEVIYALLAGRKIEFAIEAGSGFGVSGMYILSAISNGGGALISFEAGSYYRLAQDSLTAIGPSGIVINEPFENFEKSIIATAKFDFAFLDAIHDRDHLMQQWNIVLKYLQARALVIIDDIGFGEDTKQAWSDLALSEKVAFAATVNGRLGILETK